MKVEAKNSMVDNNGFLIKFQDVYANFSLFALYEIQNTKVSIFALCSLQSMVLPDQDRLAI